MVNAPKIRSGVNPYWPIRRAMAYAAVPLNKSSMGNSSIALTRMKADGGSFAFRSRITALTAIRPNPTSTIRIAEVLAANSPRPTSPIKAAESLTA